MTAGVPYLESPDDAEAFRSRALTYLTERDGGRFAWVEDRHGRQVAMALGVVGTPGTWWRDRVAEYLADPVLVDQVLGDECFEVVHVAVAQEERRRGHGRQVLELLLAGAPVSRAVLSCDPRAAAACALYASAGWSLVAGDLRLRGDDRPRWLMATRLDRSAAPATAPRRESGAGRLRCATVLRVAENACEVVQYGQRRSVGYAATLPSPRTERIAPGHLVAVTEQDGSALVVWRWFDAVVLGHEDDGLVRLWEPAHGEVTARPRGAGRYDTGTRAYLSAGLPGADWWVAGAVTARAEDADVDLDQVERFYTEHDLWSGLL